MSERADTGQYVRRVVLPSGKTIEVVYFEEHPVAAAAPAAAGGQELHLCGSCGSDLVYPLEWEEAGATHWEVLLRCPNCQWVGTGVFDQDSVERFDERLDRGTEALVRDLKGLMRANMEAGIERFVAALEADAVLPEDFGRPAAGPSPAV
jgi:hypothetical protein